MKTVIVVNSHIDLFENYSEQYKVFEDKEEAVLYIKKRVKQANMFMPLINSVDDFKVGMMFACESADQYVRAIEVEIS